MRRIVAVIGMLVLVGAALILPKQETQATWADANFTQASFSAQLPKPEITGCTTTNIFLLGAQTKITWRYSPDQATSPTASAEFAATSGNLSQLGVVSPSTTGPVSGVYTTTFGSALLSGFFGGDGYVAVRSNQGGWQSDWEAVYGTIPFLLGNGTCTIL